MSKTKVMEQLIMFGQELILNYLKVKETSLFYAIFMEAITSLLATIPSSEKMNHLFNYKS